MNSKDLLIPRFEVLETYPNSIYKKGDLLQRIKNATNNWYNHNNSMIDAEILLEEIILYPHLFKELKWFEQRKKEDMPKKLICKAIQGDTDISKIEEWDMEIMVGWINKEKRICCSLLSFNYEYGYFPVD